MTSDASQVNTSPKLPPVIMERKNEPPFFDESKLLPPTNEYVCWLDVMGSQSIMLRSLGIASNFVMKLHSAAILAREVYPIELYPVIDGVYVCSDSQSHILNFVNRVYSALALTFILETNSFHRFVIRGGLAYGPIIRGKEALACADILSGHEDYAKRILLGMPLAQAYQTERQASPFGLALHESVRAFAPSGQSVMFGTYWKWWLSHYQAGDDIIASELFKSLKGHYAWCLKHTISLSYGKEDIDKHRALAEEYFSTD
jgi:hypothetical protein